MFSLLKRESEKSNALQMVAVNSIYPNPNQPRRRFREESIVFLADSIRRHGILQPLCVREQRSDSGSRYELIAGERRWRAASLLGLEVVPCMVMQAVDDQASAQLSIIENLQRENLNCFEEALAMEKLMKQTGMRTEEVAEVLSLTAGAVCNKMRLLRLPSSQRELILRLELTERHARASLRVSKESHRHRLLTHAAEAGLTVRGFEELIRRYLQDAEGVMRALEAPPPKRDKPRPVRKPVVKDVRVFINSVDKAVKLMRESGITLQADKTECEDYVTYSIRVPKHPA